MAHDRRTHDGLEGSYALLDIQCQERTAAGITRTEWLKKRKWFEANHKALLALSAAQWMQFRGLCLNNEEAVKAILQRIIIDDFTDMNHFAERVMELREQQPYHSMIFG